MTGQILQTKKAKILLTAGWSFWYFALSLAVGLVFLNV
jgi:hypothetical protein